MSRALEAGARAETVALYDRIAAGYQRWWAPVIEPASLRLLDLVAGVLAERASAVLVDVGAGTGPVARAAVARWPEVRVIAVDPSSGMLALGRTEASRVLEPSARRRLDWVGGVAEHLPVADGTADAVVSSFTLQYLRNRSAALREAHRVLRPGGAIAIVTWLIADGTFAPNRLLRGLLDELHIDRPPSLETGLFRSLPSAAALVRRAGFRSVQAAEGVVDYQWTVDPFLHSRSRARTATCSIRWTRRCAAGWSGCGASGSRACPRLTSATTAVSRTSPGDARTGLPTASPLVGPGERARPREARPPSADPGAAEADARRGAASWPWPTGRRSR